MRSRLLILLSLFFTCSYAIGNCNLFSLGGDLPLSIRGTDYRGIYDEVHFAQDHGRYSDYLSARTRDQSYENALTAELHRLLESLKNLSRSKREETFQRIFLHDSKAHGEHLDSPISFYDQIPYTKEQLKNGDFDSAKLANALKETTRWYVHTVVREILKQVEKELKDEFGEQEVLFLGRDFSIGEIWMESRDIENISRYHMANVSRAVRDYGMDGNGDRLRHYIYQTGLRREKIIETGMVFVDTSSGGKIPAAIIEALAEDMTDSERYQFLSQTHIRYLHSTRPSGTSLAVRAQKKSNQGQLTQDEVKTLAWDRQGIDTFDYELPAWASDRDFRRHNMIERIPKSLSSGQRIDRKREDNLSIFMPVPRSNADKIRSILGLFVDLAVLEESRGEDQVSSKNGKADPKDSKPSFGAGRLSSVLSSTVRMEIDEASKKGTKGLEAWIYKGEKAYSGSKSYEPSGAVVEKSRAKGIEFELFIDGEFVMNLKKQLGSGQNSEVYLSEQDTVIKVARYKSSARKNLLAAWTSEWNAFREIRRAKILSVHERGVFVEQEFVPGQSLEEKYTFSSAPPPSHVLQAVLEIRQSLLDIKDEYRIYLDPRADNFIETDSGEIVFIDYVPRTNRSYWRYYRISERGRALTDVEFLNLFFYYWAKNHESDKAPTNWDGEFPTIQESDL